MNQSSHPRLGIDLGGTKIEGILLSPDGTIDDRYRVDTPVDDYDAVIDRIGDVISKLTKNPDMPVGIGTPGSLSRQSPLMRNSNSTCLNGRPLLEDLANRLKRPVRIANDADCFTLSEAIDGAAQGADSVFGVILGTGVGGGLYINGGLAAGVNGIAGEWGHNPVTAPGVRNCFCGRENCVETWLSGPALERSYTENSGENKSAKDIAGLAKSGDRPARTTMDQYASMLARALANAVNIVDPEAIVLGGGLSNISELYETLPALMSEHVFSDIVSTQVVQAKHGDSSGVRGAAWLWP